MVRQTCRKNVIVACACNSEVFAFFWSRFRWSRLRLRQNFGRAVLVLERINTPEPPRYLVFVFLAFFLVLGFLIMSAEVFSAAINKDTRFLAILVHHCFVAFLALASFFFDSKDLIVTSLFLDSGLSGLRHVLHLDLRFFVRR